MASLLALLTQQKSSLQTRKGLVVSGLQHDFLSPDGKLPVGLDSGFVDSIKELVPSFREFGDVIWVRSQYEANRPVRPIHEAGDNVILDIDSGHEPSELNESAEEVDSPAPRKKAMKFSNDHDATEDDIDEELFLTRTSKREPCCIPGSPGVEFASQVKDSIGAKDLHVVKTYYSAFGSTSLLLTLRSRLITELFVCGVLTNLSVFATAMDAARYGIQITLVDDCLGYRIKERHDRAIDTLREMMGAEVMSGKQVIDKLRNPPVSPSTGGSDEQETDSVADEQQEVAADSHIGTEHHDLIAADSDHESDEDLLLHLVRRTSLLSRPSVHRQTSDRSSTRDSRHGTPSSSTTINPATSPGPSENRTANPKYRVRRKSKPSGQSNDVQRTDAYKKHMVQPSYHHIENEQHRQTDRAAATGTMQQQALRHSEAQEQLDPLHSASFGSLHGHHASLPTPTRADQKSATEDQGSITDQVKSSELSYTPHQFEPLFGPGKEEESAGSRFYHQLLPPELAETVFDQLKTEVSWERMYHQSGEVPRLVACQGTSVEGGYMPVYRHPSDQTLLAQPWTTTVDVIRQSAEHLIGHQLNHAVVQLYRGRTDNISEHSDKTLDIAPNSSIVNVSFGAQRTMRFRTKRDAAAGTGASSSPPPTPQRNAFCVPLSHNSMLTLSLATNAEYLHGIRADKRPYSEMTEAQTAYATQRISLTFRNIRTYLSKDAKLIWGQGATGRTVEDARPVLCGDAVESERLVRAFGRENQASKVDWEAVYGARFDVLHLK